MLTKGEFLDRLRENPLPEDVILQNSVSSADCFIIMGFIAGRMRRRQNVSGGEKSEAVSGGGTGRLWTDCGRSGSGSAACPALQSPGGGFPAGSAGNIF